MKYTKAEKAEALEQLRSVLRPGDTVYTILRHVSRSGMSRCIDPVVFTGKRGPTYLRGMMARAGVFPMHRSGDGPDVGGCGMDMGFHLVYNLGRTLWPDGYRCTGEKARPCHANDHSNPPYPKRDGRMKHRDSGYALEQRWL